MFFRKKLYIFLIALFIVNSVFSVFKKSATYDEIQHLSCGYAYWKTGEFGYGMEHPPFLRLWASIPLFFKKWKTPDFSILTKRERISLSKWDFHPDYEFGYKFLYENNADLMLFLGRFFIILLIIPLGIVFFNWAKSLYGEKGAYLGLILLSFSPNLIAHSRLITTDFGVSVFIFVGAYFLLKFFKNTEFKTTLFSSIFWALALASKFNSVFFILFFLLSGIFLYGVKGRVKYLFIQFGIIFFLINLFYFFSEPLVGHQFLKKELEIFFPSFISGFIQKILYYIPLPDMYLRSFVFAFLHSQSKGVSYLLGRFSETGFWYFYPLVFLLKTPVITILFLIISKLSLKKRILKKDEIFYLLPVFIYIVFLLRGKLNLGLRHMLPVYPFIFLFISRIEFKKFYRYLLLLYVISVLRVFPDYLSYFNIFISKYSTWKYTVDSNLDWGQDLKPLSKFLKRRENPAVYLSYFGCSSPDYYGINYIDFYSTSYVKNLWKFPKQKHKPKYLAVSLTNMAGLYYKNKNIFRSLQTIRPDYVAGRSIFLYDLNRFNIFVDKEG